jgi:hypothetical protein
MSIPWPEDCAQDLLRSVLLAVKSGRGSVSFVPVQSAEQILTGAIVMKESSTIIHGTIRRPWAIPRGHRNRPTGSGAHANRGERRRRTRSASFRAALADQ